MHNPASTPPTVQFHVLFVCTANLCRSPLAEHVMRELIARHRLPWTVESAGVAARSGTPMHPLAGKALAERSIAVGDWRSQRLRSRHVALADLILTAEAAHRGDVVRRQPSAASRTFTILQFARFASHLDALEVTTETAATALLESIKRVRGELQPPPGSEDVPDPMGRGLRQFQQCRDDLRASLDRTLRPIVRVQPA